MDAGTTYVVHRRARAGGPRCGFREPLDKLRGSWAEVTCPQCLSLQGTSDTSAEAAAPATTGAPAGSNEARRPKRPEELPPQLVALAEQVPTLIVALSGRDLGAVRRAFGPGPDADPVRGCAVAIAVALDWYAPAVLESPAVGAVVSVVVLAMAIRSIEPLPETAEGAAA